MPGLLREQSMVQVRSATPRRPSAPAAPSSSRRCARSGRRRARTRSRSTTARLRLATTHGIRLAAQIIDTVYNAAGATAVYEDNLLQRHFQDIHVITQHLQRRLAHYELVGRYWLGLPIDENRL